MGSCGLKIQSHRHKLHSVHTKLFRTNISRHLPFKPQTFRQTDRPFSKILQNPSFEANCKPSRCKPAQKIPQFLYVNLPDYKPENFQVKINKNGTVELSA